MSFTDELLKELYPELSVEEIKALDEKEKNEKVELIGNDVNSEDDDVVFVNDADETPRYNKNKAYWDLVVPDSDGEDAKFKKYDDPPRSSKNEDYQSLVVSDSDDEDAQFEQFLETVKTPKPVVKSYTKNDLKEFIVGDDDTCSDSESSPTFYLQSLTERLHRRGLKFNSKIPSEEPQPEKFNFQRKSTDEDRESPDRSSSSHSSENGRQSPSMHFIPKRTPKSSGRMKLFAATVVEQKNNVDPEFVCAERFVNSLSEYKGSFRKDRQYISKQLYTIFNKYIFSDQLPESFDISWNVRLTKTAGLCCCKTDYHRKIRIARIELSDKVCDSADRLRDTLVHELCHAATWLLNGNRIGHGRLWKQWARKCTRVFPNIPEVSRCHSYEISAKYTYRCVSCSYEVHRHSKSLDTERKVCGRCRGTFQLYINSKSSVSKTPSQPKKFALFVQANYSSVRKTDQKLSHKEVMCSLSTLFKQQLNFEGVKDL